MVKLFYDFLLSCTIIGILLVPNMSVSQEVDCNRIEKDASYQIGRYYTHLYTSRNNPHNELRRDYYTWNNRRGWESQCSAVAGNYSFNELGDSMPEGYVESFPKMDEQSQRFLTNCIIAYTALNRADALANIFNAFCKR